MGDDDSTSDISVVQKRKQAPATSDNSIIILIMVFVLLTMMMGGAFYMFKLSNDDSDDDDDDKTKKKEENTDPPAPPQPPTTTNLTATNNNLCDKTAMLDAANKLMFHLNDEYVKTDNQVLTMKNLKKHKIVEDTVQREPKTVIFQVEFDSIEGHCTVASAAVIVSGEIVGHGFSNGARVRFTVSMKSGKLSASALLLEPGKVEFKEWESCKVKCETRQAIYITNCFPELWQYWGDKLFPKIDADSRYSEHICFQA